MSTVQNEVKSRLINLNFDSIDGFRIEDKHLELIKIFEGEVQVSLKIPIQFRNFKDQIQIECEKELLKLPDMQGVVVEVGILVEKTEPPKKAQGIPALEKVKNIIAVCSGKGGVGKSTVTANLAAAYSDLGYKVGVMDVDIYGPSMKKMFGIEESPGVDSQKKLIPVQKNGIKVVSMAMFTDDNSPLIWRGPMVSQMVQNFLTNVVWGELDYILIDLPPGTGDIHLTLTQTAPLSGALIVTTPQEVSVIDAKKGLKMFEKVAVPILGVIENMSYFVCDECSKHHHLFQQGGGKRISSSLGVPFCGEIPIVSDISACGDKGLPHVWANPDSPTGKAFTEIAKEIHRRLSFDLNQEGALLQYNYKWDEIPEIA